jgi:alanine racemase
VSSARPRFFRPTWAEVDLGALAANLRSMKTCLGRSRLLFVIKGNAYGHGLAAVSRAAEASGSVFGLGVSSIEEGITVRDAGVRLPILVLGSLYPFESFRAALEYHLIPTVASLEGARRLKEAVRSFGKTQRIPCHLKLDTGMGRIGVRWPAGLQVVESILAEPRLHLQGVYTHFACADTNRAFTLLQLKTFLQARHDILQLGGHPFFHAANSAAAIKIPSSRLDMARPGLAVYGLFGRDFRPVLSLKSRIVFIKNVKARTPLSYGGTFRTRRPSRIATLPIGYADGVPRSLSNRAQVLVQGRRCPVAGTISMDMLMIDATGIPGVRVGEEAVLIGRQGRQEISAPELAQLAGTIPYEIVTGISARVPRLYAAKGNA